MHVAYMSVGQNPTSASSSQSTTERPERPERAERPERPSAAGRTGTPSSGELRDQIRATIIAAQEAARDAQNQARDAQNQARDIQNQVRIENGLPVPVIAGAPRPGQTIQLSGFADNVIPPQVVDISIAFFVMCAVMVIGWPLARALGKRLEKSGPSAALPAAVGEQLQRIEQAVEAMSIEVERISESQRFLTKLQSSNNAEHAALPASERR
ncbi:MAG: hypothetical protein ABI601_01215 [bacterium]